MAKLKSIEKSERRSGVITTKAGKKGDRAYRIVGTTSDGVRILRPKVKPTHFTSKEIRETIREIIKARQS